LHCPVMSLPRMFRTSLATIPGQLPYLSADPDLTASWRARLADLPGRKVGIAWKGNPDYLFDRLRSIPAELLRILKGASNTVFVSVQVPRPDAPPPLLIDMTGELQDFADTAAMMTALDLIVTVDTSIAHLAGALGRPVWMLNRFNSDWRWVLGRTDSPWYPTMRIFTQSTAGNWAGVLNMVRAALDSSVRGDV
jgi:Glycosyltransferase family 9 (heptosyltransferase)